MRTFTDGNGNDSTAAAKAFLAANQSLRFADLYLIGELEDPLATWLTGYESDLLWSSWGTFKHSTIVRDRITSKIGLEVQTLQVTWSPQLTAFGTTPATANPYQKAQSGFYDNTKFRLWRALLPTPGDCNTYGAMDWFGGRIAATEISRGQIKWTVNSFLDALDQPVPPNVIEASNALAGFSGAVPVLADGETQYPVFQVTNPASFKSLPPLSTTTFLGACLSPTANKVYNNNRFALGYIQFMPGSSLAGYWSPVASNVLYDAGDGHHYNQFQVFAAFPWAPTPGDQFYASTQMPPDYATALAVGAGFKGFPFVPQPQTAV